MRKILKSDFGPAVAVVINLLIAYLFFILARVAFLVENRTLFADTLADGNLARIFRGGLLFDTSAIFYINALWLVLMLFPLWLKEARLWHKVQRWIFVVANGLAFAINLADSVYYPFTMRRTTTSVFREFDNENNLGGIFLSAVLDHWVLVLLGVAAFFALYFLYVSPRTDYRDFLTTRQRLRFAGVNFVALALAAVGSVAGIRGGLQSGVRPITVSNADQWVERPKEAALVLNTPFALLRTIGKNVFSIPNYYASVEEAAQVFDPIHPATKAQPHRKNVVILIVESFGREYIGAFNKDLEGGRYKGYTPNVDQLIAKSCVFEYSFANGHKSIDGMPSVLCSIPMFVEPFILTPASMNTYTGLPGLLARWGYDTAFFHGANRGSMGFLAFAKKIGFKNYYGRQDYAADPRFGGDKDFDGNWGIWDEPFMQYYCTKMGEMKQPFMTAIFTVSSHHPFVIPKEYKTVYKEEGLPIHKCIRYTDHAIGRFFASASKQPWFKNTIFVLTSDHTNQTDHPEYQSAIGGFSAPIIIYDPSGEIRPGMRPATVAQQIDILPTILGQLGYDKRYLSFGCDLLHTPAQDTYAVNYVDGIYQYAKYGYVLQFDGQRVRGVYALGDRLMRHNLQGKVAVEGKMLQELKAIIYEYMFRMVNDQLRTS